MSEESRGERKNRGKVHVNSNTVYMYTFAQLVIMEGQNFNEFLKSLVNSNILFGKNSGHMSLRMHQNTYMQFGNI